MSGANHLRRANRDDVEGKSVAGSSYPVMLLGLLSTLTLVFVCAFGLATAVVQNVEWHMLGWTFMLFCVVAFVPVLFAALSWESWNALVVVAAFLVGARRPRATLRDRHPKSFLRWALHVAIGLGLGLTLVLLLSVIAAWLLVLGGSFSIQTVIATALAFVAGSIVSQLLITWVYRFCASRKPAANDLLVSEARSFLVRTARTLVFVVGLAFGIVYPAMAVTVPGW